MEQVSGQIGNSGRAPSRDVGVPAAITDTGCERELNEDRYAVVESPSGLAWLVCDGMGGQAGGELAAQLAVDGIRRNLEQLGPRQCVTALTAAIKEANRIILLRRQNEAFAKMGTTVVGVLFSGIEVALGNVGDSRAYLIRNGSLEQLSVDHTYVQELVASGQITLEEAADHPQAHVLTRAVGSETGVIVDVSRYWIWQTPAGESDDVLLLCSDGLYSHVEDDEIAEMVSQMPAHESCTALVDLAKERGGYDNITVAVIPIGGQLKDSAPSGYDEDAALEKLKVAARPVEQIVVRKTNWIKLVLSVGLISFLTMVLVALGVLFSVVE
jgi:PPM family protein phosphatase